MNDIAGVSRFGVRERGSSRQRLSSPRLRWLGTALLVTVAVLVTVFLAVCSWANASGQPTWVEQLRAAAARSGSSGDPLRIDSVTEFEWDTLHVFAAYTDPERITRGLGFEWEDGTVKGPDSDEGQLVVFVRNSAVVSSFELNRCDLELPAEERMERGLAPAEAVFQVEPWEFVGQREPGRPTETVRCWRATPLHR